MAHDVFISYSHKDKATADAICARLERDGIRCWYAPRDITPGAEWAGAIINAIKGSRVMVLIFSDFSNASRQVLREVSYAVQEGVTIIPFRITDTKPTESMEYYLVSVHWLDAISQPLEEKTDELAEKIRGTLGRPAPVAVPEPVVKKDIPAGRDEKAEKKEKKTEYKTAKKAGKDEKNEAKPSGKGKWLLLLLLIPVAAGILWAAGVFGKPETQPGTEIQETVETQAPAATEAPAVTEAPAATEAPAETASAAQEEMAAPVTGAEADFEVMTLSDGTGMIRKYLGNAENLVIPEELNGKKVTAIGESAFFKNATITKVTIPAGVTEVGDRAFFGCSSLVSAILPDGLLKIGDSAFLSCASMTECRIPDTVVSIGRTAFFGCEKMTAFRIPPGVETISENAFGQCYALTDLEIAEGVKEIGRQAFLFDKELENVTLPEGLETIGEDAFNMCASLGWISIPSTVRTIGPGFLSGCNRLWEIRLAEGNPYFEIKDFALYGREDRRLICYPCLRPETAYTVQEGTEIIGKSAFGNSTNLTEVNLPEGLLSIEDDAFKYCMNLRSVNIPDSVRNIGEKNPFAYATKLSGIRISEDHPSLYLKDGVLVSREDQRMVSWLHGLEDESCTVPEGIRVIGAGAFQCTPRLTEIVLPEGVESIGNNAFSYINRQVTIRIPESVQDIGMSTFSGSNGLTVQVKKDSYAEIFCRDINGITVEAIDE